MGILKEYREKGIGSNLLKQIIDLSKEYGYEKLSLMYLKVIVELFMFINL